MIGGRLFGCSAHHCAGAGSAAEAKIGWRNTFGGTLFRVVGMEAGGLFRLLAALVGPVKSLYQVWRPNTGRVSITEWANELATRVQENEKSLQRELRAQRSALMRVEFAAAPHPDGNGAVLGRTAVDEIAVYFELLGDPHQRRMIVLGEPGSGKTVAATYLVLELLKLRWDLVGDRLAEEPVPVRVNAAGWNGKEGVSRWLATTLSYDYRLRPNVVERMIDRGLVLPVIDGLDEMDTADGEGTRARALLDRLNHAEWRDRPVVVLCRTTPFGDLARHGKSNSLHGATNITLQELPTRQILDYLTTYRHDIGTSHVAWSDITSQIRDHPDSPLATALETPWLLGLTVTTLAQSPDTADQLINCPDIDSVREVLFAAQIPAAVAAAAESDGYTSGSVEKWMRSLALCLQHRLDAGRDGTAIRLNEIWEIAGPSHIRDLHGTLVGLMIVVSFALQYGLATMLSWPVLLLGLWIGLMVAGIAFPPASRMVWKLPSGSRLLRGLATGLVVGLVVALTGGLLVWFVAGRALGMAFGIAGGLTFGLGAGLLTGEREQSAPQVDERRLIRDNIHAAALAGISFGLVFGLVVGIIAGPAQGRAAGIMFGIMVGVTVGLTPCRYYIAVAVFRFTGKFSEHPTRFLDWARRSGLLRVNGTAYQFRHETYQQWIRHRPDAGAGIGIASPGRTEPR